VSDGFTAEQPKSGEIILNCGHVYDDAERDRWHWLKFDPAIRFRRPDGTHGESSWLYACDPCYRQHGRDVPVRGDGVWLGDDPAIKPPRDDA
jgi:hypothetical protein